jgi:hypothetical protein
MSRSVRAAAYIAAGLAFVSAATTGYWLLGGTALLDTLGGSVERLARDRSSAAFALAAVVVVIKSGAGILALLLLRPAWRGWRMIVALDIFAAAVLCLWGGANVNAIKLRGCDFDGGRTVVEDLVVLSAFDGPVARAVAFDDTWVGTVPTFAERVFEDLGDDATAGGVASAVRGENPRRHRLRVGLPAANP